MSQIKAMDIPITQANTNVTATSGTVAIMSDIFVFKVPRHTVFMIRPEDTISAYFKDAGAEAVATDTWELVLKDPNGFSTDILSAGIYTTVKEFQDKNKTKKLNVSRTIGSDWYVALRFKATTVLVAASCYFQLTGMTYARTN